MPDYDPLFTVSALNMAIVSLHRITSSGDRIILDREYDRIINNLNIGEIKADREIIDLYSAILKAIQMGRLRDEIRTEINRNESQKKQKSVKEILTGNAIKSFHVNPVKWLKKFVFSSASEYFSQQKEVQESAEELIKNQNESLLRLKEEEIEAYHELQRRLFNSSWKLLSDYHLPDSYRLTPKLLGIFLSAMNESDPSKRLQMMKYLEGDLSMYSPYWFYRAQSAIESGRDEEAVKYFERFGEVWRPILRKDQYRAEAMKFKIEGLMRWEITAVNAVEILECLEEMRANTELEDWRNNLFAGMVYFSLGCKEEAEDCVMCNIVWDFESEISSSVLDEIRNAELPGIPPMSDEDFIELCKSGDAEKVAKILKYYWVNVNAKDNDGRTALIWAAEEDHAEVAEILINAGANVNARSMDSFITSLMLAATEGHTEIAKLLLKHGADVNATNYFGMTALTLAINKGNAQITELLLKHGANVNDKDYYGHTVLMKAASNGHTQIVEILIKHGADVNAKNNDGNTALMLAAEKDYTGIAELLLKHGAVKYDANIHTSNNEGSTALQSAGNSSFIRDNEWWLEAEARLNEAQAEWDELEKEHAMLSMLMEQSGTTLTIFPSSH